jgi:HK97 family phage portal protein
VARPSLKQLAINFYNGMRLLSGTWRGGGNAFTSSLSSSSSEAGISVNQDTALNYTAFWACVRLLSETLASLPFKLYEQIEYRKKIPAVNHPLYRLLHDEPNPEMDSFSFIETLMYHLIASNGNCYSYIDWDEDRTVIKALWIMNPDKVTKGRDSQKNIIYTYQFEDGARDIPAYRVWHIPGFGFDGLVGYTPLTYARNLIGLGVAAERMGSKLFANGLTFGGFLQHPKTMTAQAQKNWEDQLKANHEGVDKAHRLLILEEGMTYNRNSIPPNDAQWLETRKFQNNQMAAFFRVKPHMIGDLERATFSNIEEQSLEFDIYTMRSWIVRWERSGNRQLLLPGEKGKLFTKFNADAILRGDLLSRYQAYSIGRNWGWLSANDVLDIEDLNSIGDQGDIYMAPANMIPADQFNAQTIARASQQPASKP